MKEETAEEMSKARNNTYLTSPMTGYDQHTSPMLNSNNSIVESRALCYCFFSLNSGTDSSTIGVSMSQCGQIQKRFPSRSIISTSSALETLRHS